MTKTLTITWRSEDYGQYDGAGAAFRLYDTGDLSERAVERIHAKARRCGFTFCYTRYAWIAWRRAAAQALVRELEGLGYPIAHAGIWSSLPPLPDDAPGDARGPGGPPRS